jgi:tRNA wybutosine-synthesizing protein 2
MTEESADGLDPSTEETAPLAVLVERSRAEPAIASLREEDVYDEQRQVVDGFGETVVLPVTDPPSETRVLDVVRQHAPDRRPRTVEEHLEARGWTDAEIERAPSSWAVIGTVVLVWLPAECPDEAAVGEALLDLHGEADTVLAREHIQGPTRTPEHRVIAGTGDTETIHTEHGTQYALDLDEVMFSPGNEGERTRLGAAVAASDTVPQPPEPGLPADDPACVDAQPLSSSADREHVFDMFAGIGYFTLPAARAGARVTATEINPESFRYLIENAALNDVTDRITAYRADCREVASQIEADRVVMGHYDAREYLDAGLGAVRDGGLLHYHAVASESDLPAGPIEDIELAAGELGRAVEADDPRRVKSYGEGLSHVVVDTRVSSSNRTS